jgi:dipeptidyl aminopeptidase/acylaminoacyl peptidase
VRFLLGLLAIWLFLSAWLVLKPKEPATPPVLPWLEVKPTLSHTGRWLAFEADPKAKGVFGRDPEAKTEIVIVDREEGNTTRLSSPKITYRSPRLSGTGDRLVFEGAPGPDYLSDVYLMETEGSKPPETLTSPWRTGGHGSAYTPNISQDGAVVSFVTYRPHGSNRKSWERAVALGPPDKITTPFPFKAGIASGLVALSPDGSRVAWENRQLEPDGSFRGRLLVGQNGKTLTLDEPAWEPSLSKSRCAYVVSDEAGVYQIALHDFTTKARTVLTTGNDDSFEPSLSSDGKYLVFTSYASDIVDDDRNEASDIFFLDLETRAVHCISKGGDGNSYNPTLSGDGSTVAFSSLATNLAEQPVPAGQIYLWERGWKQCREALGY